VTDVVEYRFHEGARSSLRIVAVLCFLLVVSAPIGIWLLIRVAKGKVKISSSEVVASGLGNTSFRFDEVARLGVQEVPIVARGIGGALVRRRVGGNRAVHLVVKTTAGKTRRFIASSYENHRDLIAKVTERARKPCEKLETGLLGTKWPNVPGLAG
jgi:hypothetical protein